MDSVVTLLVYHDSARIGTAAIFGIRFLAGVPEVQMRIRLTLPHSIYTMHANERGEKCRHGLWDHL